jgi:hypothetical protein
MQVLAFHQEVERERRRLGAYESDLMSIARDWSQRNTSTGAPLADSERGVFRSALLSDLHIET